MSATWSCRFEWQWGDVYVGLLRSDAGIWGYGSTYYDGRWGWFGLGRLLHVSWGPR